MTIPATTEQDGEEASVDTEPKSDNRSIGSKTMSAGAATAVSQVLKTAINMGGMMVIARILAPADYGLLGKVVAITGIVTLFGDLGLSAATIQREKISQDQLSVLFWINVAAGSVMAMIIALSGPLLVRFYEGDQRVSYVTCGFALSCLIGSVSPQHIALLKRRLQFDRIAVIEITAALVSVGLAILAARYFKEKYDIGYVALLVQILVMKTVVVAGSWLLSGWTPGLPKRNTGSMSLVKMGGNLTASNFVNYFARNFDNMLIAKVWGESAVGLYARAYGILLLPLQQISGPMSSVAVPALSRLQNSPERYRAFFKRGCDIAMLLQIPITAFAAIAGREIILVMLGDQWLEAVPIFYALVPALIISATAPATVWVYLSIGHTDRHFKFTMFNSVVIVIGFAIAVAFGPVAVAASFSAVAVVLRVPAIIYCFKGTPLKPSDFWTTLITPGIATLVAIVASLTVAYFAKIESPFLLLLLKATTFGLVYAATILPTRVGRSFLGDIQTFYQEKIGPRLAR